MLLGSTFHCTDEFPLCNLVHLSFIFVFHKQQQTEHLWCYAHFTFYTVDHGLIQRLHVPWWYLGINTKLKTALIEVEKQQQNDTSVKARW